MSAGLRGLWALLLICFGLTVLDILVVETFFRSEGLWDLIIFWHVPYWIAIFLFPLIFAYETKSYIPLAGWLFFLFGLEDTLFYALQGSLPVRYWGVMVMGVWEPSLWFVLQVNVVGLFLMVLVVAGMLLEGRD